MNTKKLILILISCVLIFSNNGSFAVEEVDEHELFHNVVEVKDGSQLTLKDCISSAFRNSPKIRKRKYELDLAKANVGIAKSQFFPVISAGVGFYNQNNSNNIYYNSHYRELPSVGASINQLVWNFGKSTAYIKMEKFYQIGAEYEFMDSICSTLFDVKAKYYNVLRTKAMTEIAGYNQFLNENFVKLAKSKKQYDLLTAEIYLNDTMVKGIEAQNNYKNALIDLSNAMFIENHPDYTITPTKTFNFNDDIIYNPQKFKNDKFIPEKLGFEIDKAVDIAYENSPDLKVLIAVKDAMQESLKYIKRTYFPDLTADVGYGFNNTNIEGKNNSLRVGVNLISSVNLMELKHGIKGAQAEVNIAGDEIEHFKKDLYFEVKRALNNVEKSENQIITSKLAIENAFNNLQLIEKAYKADEVDHVALQDARKDYINALSNYVNAMYDYNLALIQVEMAMHYHITDIHHKSDHAVHYHSDDLIEHLEEALDCNEEDIRKNEKRK